MNSKYTCVASGFINQENSLYLSYSLIKDNNNEHALEYKQQVNPEIEILPLE